MTVHVEASSAEDDPVFPGSWQFPLGQPFGMVPSESAVPSPSHRRPFGLRFVQDREPDAVIDPATISYDRQRQIGLVDTPEGAVPFARHTDGQTSTATSDGHKGMDSDTDHRED